MPYGNRQKGVRGLGFAGCVPDIDNRLHVIQAWPTSDGLYTVLEMDGDDGGGYDPTEGQAAGGLPATQDG